MSGSEPGEAGAIPAEDGADAVAPSETEAFEEIAPGTDALAAPEAEGDATTEEDAAERLLNQDEIDSLMGFEFPVMAAATQTGMQRIITSGLVSYERLPMLEVVFDGLVRIMSTSLRNLTDHNVDVGIETVASMRFGDCLNAIPLPAILAVFKVEEWDNYGLIVVDGPMIYSIVDVLLGGRHGGTSMRIEGRPYTTIERPAVPGGVQARAAGGEPDVRRGLAHVQRRGGRKTAGRHGGPRRHAPAGAAVRDAGAGARAAAAAVHGREVRPRQHLGIASGRGAAQHRGRA
jgi:hypothetical protein